MSTKNQESKAFQTFSDITQAMIDKWKKEHKGVRGLVIELDEFEKTNKAGEAEFVICSPTRAVINATARAGADKKYDKANDLMINSCVLGGDMEYLDEEKGSERIRLAVLEKIGETIGGAQARVKKL